MIESLLKFHDLLNDRKISFITRAFNEVISNYNFYYISENNPLGDSETQEIQKNIKHSKIIIIDQNEILNDETKEKLFIHGFEKTIIIISK